MKYEHNHTHIFDDYYKKKTIYNRNNELYQLGYKAGCEAILKLLAEKLKNKFK